MKYKDLWNTKVVSRRNVRATFEKILKNDSKDEKQVGLDWGEI